MLKMNGDTTKYYKFEKSGSGRVTIPVRLAKALNWEHNDKIGILIKMFDGKECLLLWRREKKDES